PAGQTVRLRVTSADVIHSFWVPRLMGKIDMIPGVRNQRWLVADQPGRYLVECSEFCGRWHARMRMEVVAVSPSEFQAWLARQPAATPTASGR
ncbi:MAG: cytochrome c oxidase subunit II, partial [Thermomicrobiaceae bacterium]|nr:cytochrome c oxidase subunit II [Thermomicrobiaceae bacterium]